MREIPSFSQTVTKYGTQKQTREELADSSPFFFNKETGTIPIAMATMSECQEIFDEKGKLIGFVSAGAIGTLIVMVPYILWPF